MRSLREIGKKVLPTRFIDWFRRRRLVRNYLKALGYEIYESRMQLAGEKGHIDDPITLRREGFYRQAVKEVMERTDLVLQQLDRKIEGNAARLGNDVVDLRAQLATLRESVDALRRELAEGEGGSADPRGSPHPSRADPQSRADPTSRADPQSRAEPLAAAAD